MSDEGYFEDKYPQEDREQPFLVEDAIKAYRRYRYEGTVEEDENGHTPEFDENIPRGAGEDVIRALWDFGMECCALVNGDLLVDSRKRVRSNNFKRGLEIVRDVVEPCRWKENCHWNVWAFFNSRIHDKASDDRTRFFYTCLSTVLEASILERVSELSDEEYKRLWEKPPKKPPRSPEEILGLDSE